ncbi:hypothetical protein D6C77_01814 [Aureobasidium pullulans]|nr:hypothetical protein D6C77_01814 [Aureobasidium pullulans]
MDLNVMIGGVRQQKRALDQLVESRKGKPRSEAILHLRTCDALLSVYAAKKNRANVGVRQVIIPAAYPPCELPFTSLKKMRMQDLLLDIHHRNDVLVVRVFGQPLESSSVQTCAAVEDEHGEVEQISIYHFGFARWADQTLHSGDVLAIKAPYLRSMVGGGAILSAYHPSDVFVLERDHQLYPAKWRKSGSHVNKSAAQWKTDGNEALKDKNFHKANYYYGRGLSASGLDDELKCDFLRNKSCVELYLGQFDAAKANALASLLNKPDEKSKQLDSKALFRAGRALYELSNYQEARDAFQKALLLSPSDKDTQSQLKRTVARIKEETEGVFNFASISKTVDSSKNIHVDQASYLSRTEVRQTEGRGRGLFTTQDIACGKIVLCEKAFTVGDTPKDINNQDCVVSPSSKGLLWGGRTEAWFNAVRSIFNSPSLAPRLLALCVTCKCPGKVHSRMTETTVPIVDGVPVVDVFRVMEIIEANSFGISGSANNSNSTGSDLGMACAVFTRTSFINHSCLGNAERSFMGDIIILRANKDIPAGAEITVPYKNVNGDYHLLKSSLNMWDFQCRCKLCLAEEQWGLSRAHILLSAKSWEKDNPPASASGIKWARGLEASKASHISSVEEVFIDQLSDTYPEEIFAGLPKIGLMKRRLWLLKACLDSPAAGTMAYQIMEDHGLKMDFAVSATGETLVFDRSNAIFTHDLVECFQLMSRKITGGPNPFKKLALETYIIMNGSAVGYEK